MDPYGNIYHGREEEIPGGLYAEQVFTTDQALDWLAEALNA